MSFVAVGFALSLIAVLLRLAYGTRNIKLDRKYYTLLLISLIGTFLAFSGFRQLAGVAINETVDYSQILTVLSLLAAGIITGYFTFTYEQSAPDERFLPTALSTCFALLFYLVFGAISFYMGKSKDIHSTEGANTVGPLIMWVLLLANSFHDFWDYRKFPKVQLDS
jgi:NADH:ubiquinone oxidoreductase subunit 2 (subunit N)